MRLVVPAVAGAAVAALGALILGEYELEGLTPIVGGLLFGLVIAEVVTVVGRRRDMAAGGCSAALAVLGMAWASWRSTGPAERWSLVSAAAWAGVALAAVAALAWVRMPGRQGAGSRPAP